MLQGRKHIIRKVQDQTFREQQSAFFFFFAFLVWVIELKNLEEQVILRENPQNRKNIFMYINLKFKNC